MINSFAEKWINHSCGIADQAGVAADLTQSAAVVWDFMAVDWLGDFPTGFDGCEFGEFFGRVWDRRIEGVQPVLQVIFFGEYPAVAAIDGTEIEFDRTVAGAIGWDTGLEGQASSKRI